MPEIKLDLSPIFTLSIQQYGLILGLSILFVFFVLFLFALHFFKHPGSLYKFLANILSSFRWCGILIQKRYIKYDMEGRINSFISKVKPLVYGYEEIGIKLKWAHIGEDEKAFFQNEQLVIVMRDSGVQNQNFVRASMTVISKTILPKTRKYLSQSQCDSVEIFIAKKLFETEKPQAMDYFFDEFFARKTTDNNNVAKLVEKYHLMDKAGLFFPIFLQELNFLGEKVFWQKRTSLIWEEVNRLAEFLKNYALRELGNEKVQLVYEGTFCRCGIVIIGRNFNVSVGNTHVYSEHIRKLYNKKIETLYLVSAENEQSLDLVDRIIESVSDLGLEYYKSQPYDTRLKTQDFEIEFKAHLTVLRSNNIQRYYDQESQLEIENYDLEPTESLEKMESPKN